MVPRRSTTRGHAGRPDGHVGHAPPPGPAEGVGHDDAHLDAGPGPQAVADAPGRAVGVERQQGGPAPLDVGQVDAGVGAHEAVAGLGHHQVAAPAQDAHRLVVDQRLVGERVVGIDRDQPALGLGDDLLGHHHHVAGGQVGAELGDQGGQLVAGPDLGQARSPGSG